MRLEIIVFLIAIAIFLYIRIVGKIPIPKIGGGGVNRFISIINGAWVQTALLLLLFLITLSYVVGGREEWTDSLRWWWESKIFLPSLLAVIGVILFVDPKWRKKINNALIFTTSAMILFSLLATTPVITSFFGGGDEDKKRGPSAKKAPQKVSVEEVQKTREKTVLAEYGTFTEVPLPPTEKLIHIRWKIPSEYNGRCRAIVVHESNSEGEIFPCESPIRGLYEVTRVGFSSDDPLERVPVEVKITYLDVE